MKAFVLRSMVFTCLFAGLTSIAIAGGWGWGGGSSGSTSGFSLDLGGSTGGIGETGSQAFGNWTSANGWSEQASHLSLDIHGAGSACEVDCTSFGFGASGSQWVGTWSDATAKSFGKDHSEAGAATMGQSTGMVNLNGTFTFD